MSKIYYKYTKLDKMNYFEDMLKHNRLYAARFDQFNDYDEGHYFYSPQKYSQLDIEFIKNLKFEQRILCLTENANNTLMWGHYSDGDRGIAMGVEVIDRDCEMKPVEYVQQLISINDLKHLSREELVSKILIQKGEEWSYENEMRVFKFHGCYYVDVLVKKIILGQRVRNEDEIKEMIQKYNPSIKILKHNETN
ncbi:MAG: hypothetical protein CVV64_18980 [Candidatus Wallbacteria bacterium HGW-Wallbacteria-1]|jgi:hypothetical protein|uniref:DUF2971 domain-containing protein n=1 Tax=Candidatus Wallbacteria bacterium HGW-Wallbacteria-1 TaxID=2013854 RepID=A0A2N1PJ82_9BACT|nr:MAG: hypothetical protein CVV64_18980 [Candidatus Wallbacteria bacterium HGW-Wallbacteria-1]